MQPPLQVADPVATEPGALGQLLLRQPRRAAQPAQHVTERCRIVAHRCLAWICALAGHRQLSDVSFKASRGAHPNLAAYGH